MFEIYNNTIKLTRGDTLELLIDFASDEPVEIKKAVFSLKKETTDESYIMQKELDNEGKVRLEHTDTNDLAPGKYVFDIQCEYDNEIETTNMGDFILLDDVTRE